MGCENYSTKGLGRESARVLQFPCMTHAPEQLPNNVRRYRKQAGMTLAEVARAMNMSHGHISNIELGQRELTAPVMIRLASIFGCKAADLLAAEHGGLSPEERDLVSTYQQIPDAHRTTLRAVAEAHQPYRSAPSVHSLDDARQQESDSRKKQA